MATITLDPSKASPAVDASSAPFRQEAMERDHAAVSGRRDGSHAPAAAAETGEAEIDEATGWRRWMHLGLAAVWFTLAVLGAILPGLPCTVFLLLTSYSLCRSSKRLHQKLLDSRWFGPTLRHWRTHRAVRPGVKTKALATMAVMIGLTLVFAGLPTAVWWSVAGAGLIGACCVLRLRVVAATC